MIDVKPLALYDRNISGGGAEGNSGRLAHLAAGQSMQLQEAPPGAANSPYLTAVGTSVRGRAMGGGQGAGGVEGGSIRELLTANTCH